MAQNLDILFKIGDKLFGRDALLTLWQELSEQFYPERAEFRSHLRDGATFADNLFDSTPVMFRRDLGNNLSSNLRPDGEPWFFVRTGDKDIDSKTENRKWLDGATAVMRREFYRAASGTVIALKQSDHDYVTFGNAALYSATRADLGYTTTRNVHLRDVVWLENDDGIIDHVQRRKKMSGRNVARRWPKNVPQKITDANKVDPTIEYELRHIFCPADEYYGDSPKRGKRRLPFVECWAVVEGKVELEVNPRHQMDWVIPRWHTMSGSQYAVSPAAIVALPDARTLQIMKRVILEAGEKAIDPPLIATEDAIQGGINIQAGGVTWVDREYDENLGAALRALELGKNPVLGIEMIKDIRESLAGAWFINKLNTPTGDKEMTAYEVGQRIKDYARGVMPVFAPFGDSYSSPFLDLKFKQLMRMGKFGPATNIPPDLLGRDTIYEFNTPVEESEGRARVYAFGEVANIIQTGSALKPNVGRNVDADKATRDAIQGTGAPADWLRSEDDVAADDAQPQAPSGPDLANLAELVKSGAGATTAVAKAHIASKKAQGVAL